MSDLGFGFAGEVEGCDLGAIRSRSRTAKSKGAKSKGSGFASEVEGCDLGAIRSRSRMAKSKGAKSKGSRFASKVEGCDLGAIRSRSRTAKWKGAIRSRSQRALGSGFDLSLGAISLAGAWLVGGECFLPLSSSSISLSLNSLSLFYGKWYLKVK